MHRKLTVLILAAAVAAFYCCTAVAEDVAPTPAPTASEYSKEFLDKVKQRISKFRMKYKDAQAVAAKSKNGDAMAQVVRDYLKPVDHPDIIDEVLNAMNATNDGLVQEAGAFVLASVTDNCLDYLIAKGARVGKPQTRAIVIEGIARGDKATAFAVFCELLKDDKEPEIVRASCARALGILKDARGVNVLVSVENDKSELLKLALIDACLQFQDDISAQCIAGLINDDSSWKIRAAAIDASIKRKNTYAVGYLIVRLRKEQGRLFGDVLKALKAITGIWKGENINAWEEWFKTSEYAKSGKIELTPRKDVPGNYNTITYHGIRTHSKNIVFIIDRSESMREKCDPKALKGDYTTPDQKFTGDTRISLVQWELKRTIVKLDKNCSFNMISFSTDVRVWKTKSVFATDENKGTAVNWVNALSPDGRTNTWGAFLAAYGCKSFGSGKFGTNPMGDTIFLLTDGDPNEGELDDPDEIAAGVAELNRYNHIAINCIAVGRFNKAFLQKLAADNGGEFMDLGD
ncbi:MAG: HEAT repeat domain-containing protein [Candidatus Brocadiia bacterium]